MSLTPTQLEHLRAQFVDRLTTYRFLDPVDATTAHRLFDAILEDEANLALMAHPRFHHFCQTYVPYNETVFDRQDGCYYKNHPVRPLMTPVDDWCVYQLDNLNDKLSFLCVCRPSERRPAPIDWSGERLF